MDFMNPLFSALCVFWHGSFFADLGLQLACMGSKTPAYLKHQPNNAGMGSCCDCFAAFFKFNNGEPKYGELERTENFEMTMGL